MKEYALTDARPMTVEEYIEFEERAEIRHEFIDNQLIPMPGTTDDHNDICINLTQLLKMLLKPLGKFKVHQENVKVQILHERDYTYPDVVVISDPRDFDTRYIKKFPPVIFEVISKTTRIDDQVDKFIRYKNIASLQNYILVDSEKAWVEVRYKTEEGEWEANTYFRSDEKFPVPALGLELKFEDVYEGVSFL
jgi:Uma2 family endonuclease